MLPKMTRQAQIAATASPPRRPFYGIGGDFASSTAYSRSTSACRGEERTWTNLSFPVRPFVPAGFPIQNLLAPLV
jgi:hypothetical protein